MNNWRYSMKPTVRKVLWALMAWLVAMPALLLSECAKAQGITQPGPLLVPVGTMPSGMVHFVDRSTLHIGAEAGVSVFTIKARTSDGVLAVAAFKAINCYRDTGTVHFFTLDAVPIDSAPFRARDGTLATAYVGTICTLAILNSMLPPEVELSSEVPNKGLRS